MSVVPMAERPTFDVVEKTLMEAGLATAVHLKGFVAAHEDLKFDSFCYGYNTQADRNDSLFIFFDLKK